MLSGLWIFIAIGVAGIVSAFVFGAELGFLQYFPYTAANSFTLTAIGTFLLMGEFLLRGGLTEVVYRGASVLAQWVHGSLYYANILAATMFGAISGSSIASSATIGSIAIPQLDKRGYNREITLGTIAGGGTLGNLIPPSITLIIYGALTGESVGRLFMAGLIPGLVMSATMMTYLAIRLRVQPHLAPAATHIWNRKETLSSLAGLLPIVVLVIVVLGSIYTGFATPTEAGALGAFFALVLGTVHQRRFSLKLVTDSALSAASTTCMVMVLIVFSSIPAIVFSELRLSQTLIQWTADANLSPVVILVGISLLYVILGMFIDTTPVMVMTLSTMYPLAIATGWDGVWFGVVVTILNIIGLITPPVGLSLYATMAVAPGSTLKQVSMGSIPFVLILLLGVVILMQWPQLALWLPGQMF